MVEAWTTDLSSANMVTLLDVDGFTWGKINLYAATSYTEYEVKLGPVYFVKQTEPLFFPLQWSLGCFKNDTL